MSGRFRYNRTSQMITDELTGYTYYGNQELCDLLNQLNDKNDKLVESFDEYYGVLLKYGIKSPDKLDKVLFNQRVW